MKLAAIDIGSNAARLLIVEILKNNEHVTFNKLNLVRVPLRLGLDVFKKGEISPMREKMILESMQAFRHLIDAYEVNYFRACATSAMRDAKNSKTIIKAVKKKADITIDIISGDEEASLVFENHIAETLNKDNAYLYIDVGGGSTELSFMVDGKHIYRKSFNIGTIRLLQGLVTEDNWNAMKIEIQQKLKINKLPIVGIGSGGNINKVFSISKRKDGSTLTINLLSEYLKKLSSLSIEERMIQYNFKEDRADVIVPALQIYVNVMHWAGIKEILVPKIGVADGLIHQLYENLEAEGFIP
ncbi:MAG: exopolyphosphatase [Pseudopedobacter saltans]|uniref:Exopolyphosphatase n=1 Tax=Pseudopedobacter saltans TaxID=151895 RepID=A0A2W5F8C7_9SPHI|nr:MAG: exopolyphosphatase [Pseudopedobacter saltans]